MTSLAFPQEHDRALRTINPSSAAKMARLLDQHKLFLDAMHGLFPEHSATSMSQIFDVLNVACGPGAWVNDVAHTYPEMDVIGIDTDQAMISYARAHAHVRNLSNAHFETMPFLEALDFPDASFDLVYISSLIGQVPPSSCSRFLAECLRVLRPGGMMRITDGEWASSNTLAFDTLMGACIRAMFLAGLTFSPTGRTIGNTQMIVHLLRKAGLLNVCNTCHILDFSYGSKAHEGMYQNYQSMFKLAESFLLDTGVVSATEFDDLYERALTEMLSEDFCASWLLVTSWAEKASLP